ncbi:MAG: hypothetical protein HXX81_05480 [Campylobacterales bacterium]|nr:hypothetical protein [Campylobacterales bacterium]
MSKCEIVKTIDLSSIKGGVISISKVSEPYGKGSDTIASIGISLKGDINDPDWKVHLPLSNIDDVCEALQAVKNS